MENEHPIAEAIMKPTADSEWIKVRPKSRRRARFHHLQGPAQSHQQVETSPHKRPSSSLSDKQLDYNKIRAKWEQSTSCADLKGMISACRQSYLILSRALCLGIGTFDPPDGAWEAKDRAFVQLAAFLIMVEELGKHCFVYCAHHLGVCRTHM